VVDQVPPARSLIPGGLRSGLQAAIAVAVIIVLGACAGATLEPSGSGVEHTAVGSLTPSAPPTPSGIPLPVEPGSTVEGVVDIDGHDIYARCAGDGSPTVLYFTGWGTNRSKRGVAIAKGIEAALGPDIRVCSYERRNTGRSEEVEGTQTPGDVVADIEGFTAALAEEGPFILLGASFGGLVASLYAVAHPEKTAGMVLLDASTGVDYEIDEMHDFQDTACTAENRQADAFTSLEKIDNCSLEEWIHDRRAQEPAVPMIYLAAEDPSERGDVEDDALRMEWVNSWSPGEWRTVSAPHWMDEANTGIVADAIRDVIELAE
jgi:pimeloyl-ACP methyl ester carboxylesterase